MLRIQLLFCCIAFVSASRLLRRELEDGEATGTVCINWFGNNLDWENMPFKPLATMSPWGYTPGMCTEEIVQGYGEYHCAAYDSSSSEIKACNGDCFNGVCVNGYATPEPTIVCSVGEEQNGIDCWPCTPGTFNSNVGGVCSPCPQGMYASEFGSVTCSLCEIGFVAPNEASQECEACPEGYVTEGLGQTECVSEGTPEPTSEPTLELPVCSAGEELLGSACVPCFPGTYNPVVGGVCDNCSEGTYAIASGSEACTPCDIGMIAPLVGSQGCMMCPEGFTTDGFGQTECVPETTKEPTMEPTLEPEGTHTLLIRQTITTGVWPTDVLELNSEDPENDNYAILNQLDQFRSNDGRFYFKLTWPDADEEVIYEWSQTSNPLLEDVVGYEPIHVPYTGRGWGGLEPSSKGLMDGSVLGNFKGNWFYAVGAYDTVSTGLLPAYAKADNDNGYWQTRVELYVQKKQVCSVGEELLEGACAPCIPGTYNANVGGVCTLCPVGTYASDVGSVTCTPCEIGFNGPYVGLQSCMACPEGYTTVGFGQTECIAEATNEPTMQPTSTNGPTMQPTSTNEPTMQPTSESWEIIYYQTKTTCLNGGQKISQPCNGGRGTGCSYDACMQHCSDEMECNFFFYITSRSGCILYNSCDLTRTPAYSGTTVQVTRN